MAAGTRQTWSASEADAVCLVSLVQAPQLSVLLLARFDFQFGRTAVFELGVSLTEGITRVSRLGPAASSSDASSEAQAMDGTRGAFTSRFKDLREGGTEMVRCDAVAAMQAVIEVSRSTGQTVDNQQPWYLDLCSFLDCVQCAAAKGSAGAYSRAGCSTLRDQLQSDAVGVQGEALGQTLEYLALQQPYLFLFSPPAAPPSPEVLDGFVGEINSLSQSSTLSSEPDSKYDAGVAVGGTLDRVGAGYPEAARRLGLPRPDPRAGRRPRGHARGSVRRAAVLNPQLSTLHPAPFTLHPKP